MSEVRCYVFLASVWCFVYCGLALAESGPQVEHVQRRTLAEVIPTDQLKEDVDFLFKTIEEVHPNMFAYMSEEEFATHRDGLYERIGRPMNRLEFYKEVAPVVAKLRNGHTQVYPFLTEFKEHLESGGKIFAISLRFDGENVILTKNYCHEKLPVGGAVLEINGMDASQVLGRYATYFAAECRDVNRSVLEQDKLLWSLLWLEHGDRGTLNLKMRSSDSTVREYGLRPVTLEQATTQKAKLGSAGQKAYTYRFLQEAGAGLIDIRSFGNMKDLGRFQTFLKESFKEIKEQSVTSLVIDVRQNPGGTSNLAKALLEFLTDEPIREFDEFGIKFSEPYCKANPGVLDQFKKNFPEKKLEVGAFVKFSAKEWPRPPARENPLRYGGQTFVLIDGGTASASVMFASAVGGLGIGTLIGTETMDTTSVYGECFNFGLPNSGLQVSVACKYFLFVGGKDDGRGLVPDHEIEQKPEDVAKGADTVLNFALDLIRKDS